MIIGNFIFTFIGFYAKLSLSYWGLLAHAIWTISVIGALYIYIIIDNFLGMESTPAGGATDGTLSATVIMLITSLPMLCLFFMGFFSLYLASKMETEITERKNKESGNISDAEKIRLEAEREVKNRENELKRINERENMKK